MCLAGRAFGSLALLECIFSKISHLSSPTPTIKQVTVIVWMFYLLEENDRCERNQQEGLLFFGQSKLMRPLKNILKVVWRLIFRFNRCSKKCWKWMENRMILHFTDVEKCGKWKWSEKSLDFTTVQKCGKWR